MACIKGWARRLLKLTDPQELRTYIRDNFEFYHFLEFSRRISKDKESVSEKFKDLIFMTGTPMYDSAGEIISLFKLLRSKADNEEDTFDNMISYYDKVYNKPRVRHIETDDGKMLRKAGIIKYKLTLLEMKGQQLETYNKCAISLKELTANKDNSFLRELQSISMGVVMSGGKALVGNSEELNKMMYFEKKYMFKPTSLLCMTGYIIAEKDNSFDPMGEPIKGMRILINWKYLPLTRIDMAVLCQGNV
ncbi:hypothetical protein BDK51DRAFT_27772 [Blyttiomyces helicus]|uniref:Uncharacterized protein n=1 Tax=Blyttiomyces helicus TaxID=388810 RepID=A0A4P9WCP5_9FUNG|nr:hypothetical protein BDK51DRAFT_27772 [Blyttiomyces helicus]|eukprot:RKO88136.1 hypothetical protein BDK51DRAFT_27772 [Blyttiomyces helicus]